MLVLYADFSCSFTCVLYSCYAQGFVFKFDFVHGFLLAKAYTLHYL